MDPIFDIVTAVTTTEEETKQGMLFFLLKLFLIPPKSHFKGRCLLIEFHSTSNHAQATRITHICSLQPYVRTSSILWKQEDHSSVIRFFTNTVCCVSRPLSKVPFRFVHSQSAISKHIVSYKYPQHLPVHSPRIRWQRCQQITKQDPPTMGGHGKNKVAE